MAEARWIIAGTLVTEPYPCRCQPGGGRCSPVYCPCAGRDMWPTMPSHCCAQYTQKG